MMIGSPFSAVILTMNEMLNIEHCIKGLQCIAREILVVDSGSTDGTVERARALGATVVYNKFTTHGEQWRFALGQPLLGDWVIAIDADQRVTRELAEDLLRMAKDADPCLEGIYVNRLHVFRGMPLRHGGLFPKWMLKVFRKGAGFTDEREISDHRFYVKGRTDRAIGLLLEDNRNEADISFWIDKHNRLSSWQAAEELERMRSGRGWAIEPRFWGTPDQRVIWLKTLWYRMPKYSRPFLYFFYRYILRLGFLDRKQGLLFHVLQAFWYRFLVDIKLEDLETAEAASRKSNENRI